MIKTSPLLWTATLFVGCNAVLGISDDPVIERAGAASASGGGSAGNAGSEGKAGNAGNAGSSDQSSGAAGLPGEGGSGGALLPEQPEPGEPCEDEGEIVCAAHASPQRLLCEDSEFVVHDPCGEGELCDSDELSAGACAPVATACLGRQPFEAFCEGEVRSVCGPDLVSIEQTTCDSVQLCTYGSGAACATCLPNEHHCSGETLQVCNDQHSGFDDVMTCVDEPCNAEAGACTIYACTPAGFTKCDADNNLVECATDQMSWELVEECGSGTCDPEALECDVCSADVKRCEDEIAFECSSDGQDESSVDCTADQLHCLVGECVECKDNTHCDPPDDCHTAYCNLGSGACEATFKGLGAVCDGTGVCNAAEVCVECLNTADDCLENTQVCRAGVCEDAIDEIGFKDPIAGTGEATVLTDTMYVLRLPTLSYDAELVTLGFHGKSGTGSAKMALYAGDATLPSGAPLAESAVGSTWLDGVQELVPDQIPTLMAGSYYWLAIKTNADVLIRTQSNASSIGRRYVAQTYSAVFPTLSTSGSAQNGSDWNLFISIRYIE